MRGIQLQGALVLALCAAPALAQGGAPRFLVSTSADVTAGAGVPGVLEGDLVLIQEGAPARVAFGAGHWLATTGLDLGDVDGLARRPGAIPGTASALCFSTLSNVGGFRDGDVLGLIEGGGVEVVVPEDAFTNALGLSAGSVDVDAVAFDDLGLCYVSFQDNETGTTLGDVMDGDVLRLGADGSLTRVMTELDVDGVLTLATGSTASVTDVLGLDFIAGQLIVSVQSPSAYDGAVISCGPTPALLVTDAGAGLGGAEVDALMYVTDEDLVPVVRTEPATSQAGGTVHVEFSGDPGAHLLVLYAGTPGYLPAPGLGFGAWYLDPADPWLNSILAKPAMPLVPLGADGTYGIDYTLPVGVEGVGIDGGPGWTFQVIDLGSLELGAPFRVGMI